MDEQGYDAGGLTR